VLEIEDRSRSNDVHVHHLAVFGPLVLATDLLLFLRGEVVGDVESLSDLLWRLALDHVCDGLAPNIKERLNVEVVGGKDDLKEHLLIDLHELLVPLLDVGSFLAGVGIIICGGSGVVAVMLTPFEDLLENLLIDVGNGDFLLDDTISKILQHVLDQHGAFSNDAIGGNRDSIVGGEGDLSFRHLE